VGLFDCSDIDFSDGFLYQAGGMVKSPLISGAFTAVRGIACYFAWHFKSKTRAKRPSTALSAPSQLQPGDRRQDKPARKQPEQERHNLDAETGQHDALVGHQPAIPRQRNIRRGDVEDCGINSG
jgi:hypothetical protein